MKTWAMGVVVLAGCGGSALDAGSKEWVPFETGALTFEIERIPREHASAGQADQTCWYQGKSVNYNGRDYWYPAIFVTEEMWRVVRSSGSYDVVPPVEDEFISPPDPEHSSDHAWIIHADWTTGFSLPDYRHNAYRCARVSPSF